MYTIPMHIAVLLSQLQVDSLRKQTLDIWTRFLNEKGGSKSKSAPAHTDTRTDLIWLMEWQLDVCTVVCRKQGGESQCRMTPVASTLSWNNDVILPRYTSALCVCGRRRLFVPTIPESHFPAASPWHQRIGDMELRQITKSIWSGLTNSVAGWVGGAGY